MFQFHPKKRDNEETHLRTGTRYRSVSPAAGLMDEFATRKSKVSFIVLASTSRLSNKRIFLSLPYLHCETNVPC